MELGPATPSLPMLKDPPLLTDMPGLMSKFKPTGRGSVYKVDEHGRKQGSESGRSAAID
jgi:hypothetical protein